jgi:uncharacterized delta-60 repeat protein
MNLSLRASRTVRVIVLAALASALVLTTAGVALAAPGDLDPTFGGAGFAVAPLPLAATGVAIQSDGKIVTVGGQLNLARFNSDGTLDGGFGTGGIVLTNQGFAHGLVIQPDGKIVVAGEVQSCCGSTVIARYNADGSLDAGFGQGGYASSFYSANGAAAVALQTDGKTVAAASPPDAFGNSSLGVVRLNGDGSPDLTFGTGGVTAAAGFFYWENPIARAIAVQADGKIVVAGTAAAQFVLARFNPDGTPDQTFGSNGIVRPTTGYAYSMALQPDGKILEGGQDPSGFLVQVARVNSDGSLDTSFGSGGVATANFIPNAYYAAALAMQVQQNGKIVTAGAAFGSTTFFGLNRFNADGTIDTSFGNGGNVLSSFPGTIDTAGPNALAVQPDGKLVAAGGGYPSTAGSEVLVARYVGDPVGATSVKIDIKPGDYPNIVDLGSKGTIPVAILSTREFNAPKQVSSTSLKFGRTGNEASLASCSPPQDVNKDGMLDVLCHFTATRIGFQLGDTQGVLTGTTFGGDAIRGTDSVVVVSPK